MTPGTMRSVLKCTTNRTLVKNSWSCAQGCDMSRLRLHGERHLVGRIGWLRAAVLGANDGIVSTASLIVGVAAAAATRNDILIAGVAGLPLSGGIKQLTDQEFDRLLAAVLAEQRRRGRKLPLSPKTSRKPLIKEIGPPLTLAKLNAIRAAFKAGVAPSRIPADLPDDLRHGFRHQR